VFVVVINHNKPKANDKFKETGIGKIQQEDEDSNVLRNVGVLPRHYTASQP
jgi:hypothetical protein